MDDLLVRCERWMSVLTQFNNLALAFCGGMVFAVFIMIGAYLATGGK